MDAQAEQDTRYLKRPGKDLSDPEGQAVCVKPLSLGPWGRGDALDHFTGFAGYQEGSARRLRLLKSPGSQAVWRDRAAAGARLRHICGTSATRLHGARTRAHPDPSPPGPRPRLAILRRNRAASARLALGRAVYLTGVSAAPSPLHTHTYRAAGAEFIFPGVGTLTRGGGRRYQAAGRPGAGMLIEMELEARPQIRDSQEYRRGPAPAWGSRILT